MFDVKFYIESYHKIYIPISQLSSFIFIEWWISFNILTADIHLISEGRYPHFAKEVYTLSVKAAQQKVVESGSV